MSEDQYGTVNAREMRFSKAEVKKILLENIRERDCCPYNFDYTSPFIIDDGHGGFIFRFMTKDFTSNEEAKGITFKTFEQMKNKSPED